MGIAVNLYEMGIVFGEGASASKISATFRAVVQHFMQNILSFEHASAEPSCQPLHVGWLDGYQKAAQKLRKPHERSTLKPTLEALQWLSLHTATQADHHHARRLLAALCHTHGKARGLLQHI